MRVILNVVLALICLFAAAAPAATGATSKPTAPKPKKTKASSKSSPKSKKPSAAASTRRQAAPTPERYKQIQDALAAKGYLDPAQANGQWGESSTGALKQFQSDQNIDATGKINSLSLIALGLGPKHDSSSSGIAVSPTP
jgi:peptidoglycan hydrolase-like protein with peptidoglycan-binding domain